MPRFVRHLSALSAAVVMASALTVPFAAPPRVAAVDGELYVSLANAKRATEGKGPVGLATIADQIAIERANHMGRTDEYEHDMQYVEDRLRSSGTCWRGYGEIIAWERGYSTYDANRTMTQWWNSTVHHNIIVGDYNGAGGSHATSSATGKTYSVMIWVKLCTPPPPLMLSDVDFERIAGADRYSTAAALSQLRFGSGASAVFIATGATFPDALAGVPAAAKANAPILLTARDSLPAPTAAELSRLGPTRIVILGGPGAVSTTVEMQLRSYAGTVSRWQGADRYETAAAISRAAFSPGVDVVYLATGTNFPDALAGGALAGRTGGPILLVRPGSIPASTAAELERLDPDRVVALGGPSVVSEDVRIAAAAYSTSGTSTRLSGTDRYATAAEVSRAGYGAGADAVFIATGTNFPDGLAGGPVAALVPGPILLVSPTRLPTVISSELARLSPDSVYVIGGPSVVSAGVVSAMDAALR